MTDKAAEIPTRRNELKEGVCYRVKDTKTGKYLNSLYVCDNWRSKNEAEIFTNEFMPVNEGDHHA
jgi:hypothetical protein